MQDDDLVVVHTFSNQFEADIAMSALEAAEIDAMVQADTASGMRPHIAWASGGFKVLVREDALYTGEGAGAGATQSPVVLPHAKNRPT